VDVPGGHHARHDVPRFFHIFRRETSPFLLLLLLAIIIIIEISQQKDRELLAPEVFYSSVRVVRVP